MKTIKHCGICLLFIIILLLIPHNVKSAEEVKTNVYLDYPNTTNINQDSLYIDGWVMSTYANKTIQIYIDGILQQATIETRPRPDVHKSIKGYGTEAENPKPGFKTTLNLKNVKDGNHTLEVRVVSDTGKKLYSSTKKFTLKKYNTNLNIDYPNTSQINQDSMEINGWVMSTVPNKTIKIYIDNQLQQVNLAMRERPDVHKAIKGYGTVAQNPTPGFKTTLSLKKISDGNHTLKIEVLSNTGEILTTYLKNFNLKKYSTKLNIDYPNTSQCNQDSMEINGWVLSSYANKTIQIYVDNQLQQTNIAMRARPDVHKAITGYGTTAQNPTPGFKTTLNLKKIADGNHTLKINIVADSGEILATYTRNFTLKKYTTKLNVDYPNTSQIRQDTMQIDGWIMSTCANKTIQIYIDNQLQQPSLATRVRPDVHKAITGYGTVAQNSQPGFKTTLDLTKISDGNHTLKINSVADTGEVLATYTKSFSLKKYPSTLYIDIPEDNFITGKKQLEVSGWVMSGYTNANIQIYINKVLQNATITRRARTDVQKAITGYGTVAQNPTPGFSSILDISALQEGNYTITVNVTTKEGTVLASSSKKLTIDRKILVGIDVSEHNKTINWEKVKKQVDFAIIRCGYGVDDAAQDDKMFYRNVAECEKYGIPYGVYIYSYATDLDKAKSEVNHVIRLLRGSKPTYGIWFDMEDADGYKSRYNVSDQMCRDITYTFCSIMKSRGYNVGIYANLNWLNGKLNDSRLDQFPKWVAQWSNKCDYNKPYVMWQYTSSGTVDGITGRVDMDYYYR